MLWLAVAGLPLQATAADSAERSGAPSIDPRCKGIEVNGPRLTGTELQPLDVVCPPGTGPQLREVSLRRGAVLPGGRVLGDVKLEGARLRSMGAPDADFSGALLLGSATNGEQVRLRVDVQALVGDIPVYAVSYQWGQGKDAGKGWLERGGFKPLCPGDERALALAGTFDYERSGHARQRSTSATEITLACEGAAAAKCVLRAGYRPWESKGVSLRPYWQACVRAIRADYCGNGDSLTQAGMTLNLYDGIGVQRDERDWPLEAQWTPDGARCIGVTRLVQSPLQAGETVRDYLRRACPERLLPEGGTCQPSRDALIFTEVPPRQAP